MDISLSLVSIHIRRNMGFKLIRAANLQSERVQFICNFQLVPTSPLSKYPTFEGDEAELVPYCESGSVATL